MKKKIANHKKQIINLGFLLATLVVNFAGVKGWINGLSQQKVSSMYQTLITPAGFTFSIWGVIYTLLIVTFFYLFISNKKYAKEVNQKISDLFIVSCILNMAWIVTFSTLNIFISMLIILPMSVVIAEINQKLKTIKINDNINNLLPITFGVYGGWLTIASVLNVAVWVVSKGWGRADHKTTIIAIITLCIASLLVMFITYKNRNPLYALTVAWAFFGIFKVKYPWFTNLERKKVWLSVDDNALFNSFLIYLIIVMIVTSGFCFYKNKEKILPKN